MAEVRKGTTQQPSDKVKAAKEEIAGAASDVRERLERAAKDLRVRERLAGEPWPVLGIALGVGYVLGGGLFSSLSRPFLRAAAAMMLLPRARERLGGLAGDVRHALMQRPTARA